MDADWYVDPLGRFDGRFFDGEKWTERVSDQGSLALDPDFPPAATIDIDSTTAAGAATTEFDGPDSTTPAVASVQPRRHLQASLMEESPARVVAVLDGPGLGQPTPSASNRTAVIWGLLGLIAALVVAGLLLFTGGDDPDQAVAEPVELDREQEQRVEDLEAGSLVEEAESQDVEELEVDAPAGAIEPGATFGPDDAIEVGGLRVLNGASVLADLQTWHADFAAERGVELASSASCWFGQLGGAAVQVAHCGPVGGSADSD